MGFFDDDPFEDIVREFFGTSPLRRRRREQFIRGEDEDRLIDFVEEGKKVYLVFELPGYSKGDVSIKIRGNELEIASKKSNGENIQGYLHQKLRHGLHLKKQLPKFVNSKRFSHTMRNGVLEIVFDKTKEGKGR